MRTFVMASICLLALSVPSLGASVESPPQPPTPAQTITPNRAFELMTALSQVTGDHDEIVGQGASARVSPQPYDLSADTLWALDDDINALRAFMVDVQAVVKTMRSKAEADNGGAWPGECDLPANNPGALLPSDPKCAADRKFTALVAAFDDKERPIAKLFKISRKDLKLGAPNKIPGSILAALMCAPGQSGACIIEP